MDSVSNVHLVVLIRGARIRVSGYISDLLGIVRAPGETSDEQLLTLATLLRVEAALTDNQGPLRPGTRAGTARDRKQTSQALNVWLSLLLVVGGWPGTTRRRVGGRWRDARIVGTDARVVGTEPLPPLTLAGMTTGRAVRARAWRLRFALALALRAVIGRSGYRAGPSTGPQHGVADPAPFPVNELRCAVGDVLRLIAQTAQGATGSRQPSRRGDPRPRVGSSSWGGGGVYDRSETRWDDRSLDPGHDGAERGAGELLVARRTATP